MQSEECVLAQLKELVDSTADKLQRGNLSLREAIELTMETREKAESLIPDMMDKYELIYESRFERLIWQFVMPLESEREDRPD